MSTRRTIRPGAATARPLVTADPKRAARKPFPTEDGFTRSSAYILALHEYAVEADERLLALEAQRDALLKALRALATGSVDAGPLCAQAYVYKVDLDAARAAIARAEGRAP